MAGKGSAPGRLLNTTGLLSIIFLSMLRAERNNQPGVDNTVNFLLNELILKHFAHYNCPTVAVPFFNRLLQLEKTGLFGSEKREIIGSVPQQNNLLIIGLAVGGSSQPATVVSLSVWTGARQVKSIRKDFGMFFGRFCFFKRLQDTKRHFRALGKQESGCKK